MYQIFKTLWNNFWISKFKSRPKKSNNLWKTFIRTTIRCNLTCL